MKHVFVKKNGDARKQNLGTSDATLILIDCAGELFDEREAHKKSDLYLTRSNDYVGALREIQEVPSLAHTMHSNNSAVGNNNH